MPIDTMIPVTPERVSVVPWACPRKMIVPINSEPNTVKPSITPDLIGDYVVELTVSREGQTSLADQVVILDGAGRNFGAHDPTTWPLQAALLANGHWAEFGALVERLDGGRYPTDGRMWATQPDLERAQKVLGRPVAQVQVKVVLHRPRQNPTADPVILRDRRRSPGVFNRI